VKRALAVLAALSVVGTAQGADWSSLWLNADQRGERLMQDGKAAEAAQTYRDPRRRAYARLAAGDYQAAARGFEALAGTSKRSDDRYNQGNALAHAGDLQGAINAYDAALALDPGNTDAAHNRKLVEEALKQRQQQSPDKHQQSSPRDAQSQNPRSGQNQNQNQDQNQHGQPPSDSAKSGTQQPAGQARQDDQQAGRQRGTQNPSSSAQSAHERKPDDQTGNEGLQAANADRAAEGEQARQDARASAPKPSVAGSQAPEGGQSQPLPDARETPKPPSEQQLAEDQWLRRIPDDPGGLLRRKFMIEHLMRQQSRQ
jgi:Ca-activated chloride channel family protein